MRLKDKIAIVTGAARGLGKAISIAMAKEGARIVAADVIEPGSTVKEIEALGGSARGLRVDVSSETETVRMAEETVKTYGRIDILLNCAAIYYGIEMKPFYEIDSKDWDKVMTVNVKGSWLCAKAVFPFMKLQEKGKIINISSETFFTGSPNFVHYVTSKGGVIGLTRALASELGTYNITVNAIAPGFTNTEASHTIADVARYDVTRTPMHRVQQPDDLFGAVILFASDESDFITGQTLLVDGGRAMH